nr:immunoglobulin light chain junction region [Macaca mulatta]MOV62500.1 immunoglobulin light chain junction region [Macaca mulatta]MOV62833.1 immunoglobulin light chain junction region [Macaca mulatta]MOV63280.1 immunoglobulin light chain junction region [Macaca mulatta]MOV64483.1 immunoglobulin light chain junction region [Macaca mulatta]
CQQHNRYPLTF